MLSIEMKIDVDNSTFLLRTCSGGSFAFATFRKSKGSELSAAAMFEMKINIYSTEKDRNYGNYLRKSILFSGVL